MSRLGNDKQELYAKHRAKGMIPAKASMAAGYAAGSSTTHLEENPEIVSRIAELMEEAQSHKDAQRIAAMEAAKVVGQMTGVTRAWVIQKLAENAQLAANEGMFKESNQALEMIGKDFGMFQGGSDEEGDGNVPKTFDMDKLDAILDQSHSAIVPPELSEIEKSRQFDNSTALRLIEGQVSNKRVDPSDREFSTGSETDVALTADAEPDADDYALARSFAEHSDFDDDDD